MLGRSRTVARTLLRESSAPELAKLLVRTRFRRALTGSFPTSVGFVSIYSRADVVALSTCWPSDEVPLAVS